MALTIVDGPKQEPVTLADVKLQLKRGDVSDEDTLINVLRTAARERAEGATNRAMITQTWDLFLDAFPCERYIELPKPPLQSITYVKYYDTSGTLQTLSASTDYEYDVPLGARCARARVALRYGQSWPSTRDQIGAVVVRFVCGYGLTPAAVPAMLRAAMLMDVASLYVDRQNQLIEGSRVHQMYRAFRSEATQRRAA